MHIFMTVPNFYTSTNLYTMPDERVDIADYLDMIRIYLLVILNTCEPAGSH